MPLDLSPEALKKATKGVALDSARVGVVGENGDIGVAAEGSKTLGNHGIVAGRFQWMRAKGWAFVAWLGIGRGAR